MMKRPSKASDVKPVAFANILRRSVSLNERSIIRLAKCGLEQSSSHSHHSGQFTFDATTITLPAKENPSFPRHQLIKPAAVVFQETLFAQLDPNLAAETLRRLDGGDLGFRSGQRAVAELGI